MKYLKQRFQELATWRGFVDMLAALGMATWPQYAAQIVAVALFVRGLLGAGFPDTIGK